MFPREDATGPRGASKALGQRRADLVLQQGPMGDEEAETLKKAQKAPGRGDSPVPQRKVPVANPRTTLGYC